MSTVKINVNGKCRFDLADKISVCNGILRVWIKQLLYEFEFSLSAYNSAGSGVILDCTKLRQLSVQTI